MELAENQNIDLVSGNHATVVRELGRGGQGIVYLVTVNGKQMALKWYSTPPADGFFRNLQKNIHAGSPSETFIWPEDLTVTVKGCFGYVMRLRPEGYSEFSHFLLAKAKFSSFYAMFTAAMKICDGFRRLHLSGYSYQDLNDGNFFINPETGDVLICDNDNVMAQGENSGIMGKARYMAPEVVAGGAPNKQSDRFSLSVLLFMLFFANHPFDGARVGKCPCMREDFERKFYGSEAVFIFDEDNRFNRPVPGMHDNVIRRWPLFPKVLKDAFVREFSQYKLKNPDERIIESEWEKIIAKARNQIVICPKCGNETFVDTATGKTDCIECGKPVDAANALAMTDQLGEHSELITLGSKIFINTDITPEAEVTKDSQGRMVIQNLSSSGTWAVDTTKGGTKQVPPKGFMPVKEGLKITFRSNVRAVIRNNQ